MISLHRSWPLPLAGPTDNITRQGYRRGLVVKMRIISPLALLGSTGVCFRTKRAETRRHIGSVVL